MKEIKLIVDKSLEKTRLDSYLAGQLKDLSRSHIKNLIRQKNILVNNTSKSPSYLIKEKDLIIIKLLLANEQLQPLAIDLPIIYEDDNIIIIDKPEGLTVHPANRHQQNTLVNALLYMNKNLSTIDPKRPGIVHRLDKTTSGVMIIAKNNQTHLNLVEQFKNRRIEKEYLAIVQGNFSQKKGQINVSLKTLPKLQKVKIAFSQAKEAITDYEVVQEKNNLALVKVYPHTGRMHQIRIHLSFIKHPILGDTVYGGKKGKRIYLHASKIKFADPQSGKTLEFNSKPKFSLESVA